MDPEKFEKKDMDSKYSGKPIRWLDAGNHYELIFTDAFRTPGDNPEGAPNNSLTDIMVDMKNAKKDKEVHVFIGSFGGEVCALNMILQQLREFKYRVGINAGMACSCGWMLLFSCQERYVSPYALNVYHAMSSWMHGKVAEMENRVDFNRKWWNMLVELTDTKKVLTADELKLGETTEIFLTGQELIDRGAALPYDKYLSRRIPDKMDVYSAGGDFYVKEGEMFTKLNKSSKQLTYVELLQAAKKPVSVKKPASAKTSTKKTTSVKKTK